jgi:KDO2-lipid IV(A) lauroyltransferase
MASQSFRAFRGRVLFRAVSFLAERGRRMSLERARRVGAMLGGIAGFIARAERKKALRNIRIAFPDWTPREHKNLVTATFRHLGMCALEMAWLPNLDVTKRDELTRFEGIERVLEVIDAGNSVVMLTAHCGNWEWLSYATGMFGRPLAVMQRERDQANINDYITELRAKSGVRTIDRGSSSSPRELIAALRRGGILGFVMDQNIRTESVKVPFFGVPAPTPLGPAKLAIRTEAYVSTALIRRGEDGIQYATYTEPVKCNRSDDAVALVARVTREIEEQIRRAPEQWVWMHDRWKERPKFLVSS